jgi:small subunit ribosomal protein S8
MVDPITDMLNRIRNAQAVSKETVVIPFSKLKFQISKILEKEGFIEKAEKKGKKHKKVIEVQLKYQKLDSETVKKGVIVELKRISKPGQRIYSATKDIRRIRKGCGIVVISTSKGIMTDKEARRQGLGGEVLFEIW